MFRRYAFTLMIISFLIMESQADNRLIAYSEPALPILVIQDILALIFLGLCWLEIANGSKVEISFDESKVIVAFALNP